MLQAKSLLLILLIIIIVELSLLWHSKLTRVCLFSEMKGIVTLNGAPVTGAEIVRTAEYNDKAYTDNTVTNDNGQFQFGIMTTRSINKLLLIIEAVIFQKLTIRYKDKVYLAWQTVKRDYEENTELDDNKSINLYCELTSNKTTKDQNLRIPITGICSWK